MAVDLSSSFTNDGMVCDDVLRNFIQQMKIRILGHGIKKKIMLKKIEQYIVPSFLLVYYIKGAVQISHAGEMTTVAAGSFFLHEPFEVYSGTRISSEPLEFLYVNFVMEPVSVQSVFKKNAFLSGDRLFQTSWYGKISSCLLEFCQMDISYQSYCEVLLEGAVKEIAAYILYDQRRCSQQLSFVHDSRESLLMDKVFAYTDQHIAEPIDIGRMLRSLGSSRSTLYRVFLVRMGLSPFKAITRFKMEKALELMQTGCSVTETARQLGYSSAYHFSNTFKLVMGKRPTEYIKKQTNFSNRHKSY